MIIKRLEEVNWRSNDAIIVSSKNKESGVEAGCFVVGFGCRERAKEPGFGVENNRRSNRTE